MFVGLTLIQETPDIDRAEGKPTSKTPPGKPKTNTNGIPVPPPIPAPAPKTPTPETEAKPTWYPAEGALGRLGGVGVMGGLLGALLVGVNRFQRRHYPDAAALRAASITYHFDFTRCFRSFVAVQGAYVLVACVTGAAYAAVEPFFLGGVSFGLCFLWFIGGVGGSGLMVIVAGAVGLDLMTQLDVNGPPQKEGSAVSRYVKRKLWLILLGGLGIGALGGAFTGLPSSEALQRFVIGSLGIGQIVAFCWGGAKLVKPKLKAPKIPQRKGQQNLPALMVFNLPFLFVLGGLLWLGATVLFGISWVYLWLGLPLGILLALGLSVSTRLYPVVVRKWQFILSFAGILTFGLCLISDDYRFFWWIFIGLTGVMVYAIQKYHSISDDEDHGWMLILPEHRGDYQPVINPTRDGLDVRWFQFGLVSLLGLGLIVSAIGFIWG